MHPADRKAGRLRTASRAVCAALLVAGLSFLSGCVLPGRSLALNHQAAEAARPILTLDPNAVWTDAYNRLRALGPAGLELLMNQPEMMQRAAPDDLRVLLHISLARLLANPAAGPPRLSACCLETTLGLLHFDLKVGGHKLGTIVIPADRRPRTWPELYPADFDHALAAQIDLEADRRALREWWLARRNQPVAQVTGRALAPQAPQLWRLLARRPADRWEYQPEAGIVSCASGPEGPALFELGTVDYNLVRAACIWLGSSADASVERQLVELVGSPLPVVAYNARFALRFSADEQIRAILRKYDADRQPPP